MPEIQVQPIGDRYLVTLQEFVLSFAHVRDHADGLAAELTIHRVVTQERHWGRLNLSSTQARASQIRAVERGGPCPGLAGALDEACYQVTQLARTGRASVPLVGEPRDAEQWLVPGLIPTGDTSILYGDGASGKSLLALALAVAGRTGRPLSAVEAWRVGPLRGVLYLDWEARQRDVAGRLYGLQRMHGDGEAVTGIRYRSMTRGLTEEIGAISREVAQEPTDLVIVDSLGAACGAEPKGADAAIRTLNALRLLDPATRLVIAHVSKSGAEQEKGSPTPYGSVYVKNLARSTIYAVAGDRLAPDELTVTYHHKKVNDGPYAPTRALSFTFDGGDIQVTATDPDLARASLSEQILGALNGGKQTVPMLAEALQVKDTVVRTTLNKLANRTRVIRLVDSEGGRGKETLWGLPLTNRTHGTVYP